MIRIEQIFSFSILKTFTKVRFTTLFVVILHQQLFAQVTDSFDDGDISTNPTWQGQTDKFVVTHGELQLVAPPMADVAYLYLESEAIINASWEFRCRFEFNPSSSNHARFYLVSDQPDLTNALNGYYVMIGNTADEVSLYKQTGTTRTKIIDGIDDRLDVAAPDVQIKVTRDGAGNWKLFSDVGMTGVYMEEGAVTDNTNISSQYAGILCTFTATRADKFFFDNVLITGDPFEPPQPPSFRDVVISEFMADPSPRQELPEVEYIELYNRSGRPFSMTGWSISDGSSNAELPAAEIQHNEYVILCSSNAVAELARYGKVFGLTGFPALNNTGDAIILRHNHHTLIDSVLFSDAWYKDERKAEGGWSLEKIDLENTCGEEDNWEASIDPRGGTPGSANAVTASKPDVQGPTLTAVFVEDERKLIVSFNEKLAAELPQITDFKIEPMVAIENIQFASTDLRTLALTLSEALEKNTAYQLTVINVFDCAGNGIAPEPNAGLFAIPDVPLAGDILINEILFNPRPGGVDFVEVVNVSSKFVDLTKLLLCNVENDLPINQQMITATPVILKPGEYLALTEDKSILKSDYNQTVEAYTREVKTLPALNDDKGTIAIITTEGTFLDMFSYTKDLHSPFLENDEGVSLERISLGQPTQDANNWKSASTHSNYATPGYVNSQVRLSNTPNDGEVTVVPELFEPVYGQPDFTEIQYQFGTSGHVANVKIVDTQGRVVKELATNVLLGTSGVFRWDGDTDSGAKARIGYYMVWMEVYDNGGKVTNYRKRIGVVARF